MTVRESYIKLVPEFHFKHLETNQNMQLTGLIAIEHTRKLEPGTLDVGPWT